MNRIRAFFVLVLLFLTVSLPGADWPTYRRDRLRRAITPEKLQLPLKQLWAFKSRQSKDAPVPTRDPTRAGFPECSKYTLPIISAGDSVYFTSSVEGRVVSMDAATAKKNWEYFAGAGVYRTPMFWEGKLYFGSEDGWAYCLEAKTGKLLWKFQAAPASRQFLSYGKMVSVWPVRTDVLVDKGEAYFSAGVFPHEGTYVYTLDANTGKLKWRNDTQSEDGGQSSLAPGGHLMVTQTQIWVPKDFRGYSNMPYGAPTSFRRSDGFFTHWPNPEDPEAPKIDSNSPWTRIFWPLFGVERDGVRYAGSTAWATENEHLNRKGVWSAETPGRWTDYDSGVGTRMKAAFGYPVIFRYDPDHATVVMAGDVLFHTAFDSDPPATTRMGSCSGRLTFPSAPTSWSSPTAGSLSVLAAARSTPSRLKAVSLAISLRRSRRNPPASMAAWPPRPMSSSRRAASRMATASSWTVRMASCPWSSPGERISRSAPYSMTRRP